MEVLFKLGKSTLYKSGYQTRMLSSLSTSDPYTGSGMFIDKDNAATNKFCIGFGSYTENSMKSAVSNIRPEVGQYYHAVGIYDNEQEKVILYVNGVKCAEVAAAGEYKHSSLQKFAIGGNRSGARNLTNGFCGDVAIARIWDDPLSAEKVTELYNAVKHMVETVASAE
jgi:hypothetical protein